MTSDERLPNALTAPRARAVSGILLLAVICTLYLARGLLIPIAIAFTLSIVFLPAVRFMKKLLIPEALSAAIIVAALLSAFGLAIFFLAEPASTWLDRAPQVLTRIHSKVTTLTGSLQEIAVASAKVQSITEQITTGAKSKVVQEVTIRAPSAATIFLGAAGGFALTALSTLVLFYFLLASGTLFLRKTIAVTPRLSDKKRAVQIAHQVESAVSHYLLTVSVINLCLGCAVGFAMYLLDVPNPMLWGAMVAVLNFVPYLGDLVSATVLLLVGLFSFDNIWHSLAVPVTFALLSASEGYLISPVIVGRRLSLNPVVMVLSVMFWGAIWGICGALLAVPILAAFKALCDRVDSLNVFGEFLGD